MAFARLRLAARNLRFRGIAATLLLGFAPLALLEGGLRLAGWPTERVRSLGKLLNFDAQSFAAAVGVFRPGAKSTVLWPPELAYEVHINALGLRGPEIARTPPPGRTRILALGDSMTFGFYLEESQTWPARLQALLRSDGRDVEVVNAGVGGWTISSETLFLEERALALAPAHVLVGFCANDIADLELPSNAYEGQKQAAAAGRGGFARALVSSALYELYLRAQVAWKHWRERRTGELDHPLTSVDVPAARAEELWRVYAEWVDRLHRALAARDIELTLVYLPDVYKLANGIPADDEARLRALAQERGIGFVSPLDDFAGRPLEELFLRPFDDHLAPDGAERVARAVAEVLLRRERHDRPTAANELGGRAKIDVSAECLLADDGGAGCKEGIARRRAAHPYAEGVEIDRALPERQRHFHLVEAVAVGHVGADRDRRQPAHRAADQDLDLRFGDRPQTLLIEHVAFDERPRLLGARIDGQ